MSAGEGSSRRAETVAGGLLRTARPKQWAKNLLVFAAPAGAGVIDQAEPLAEAIIAFASFCLAASGTYLLNDVADREADARHPTKRHRAVASGLVSPALATVLGVGLIVGGLALGLLADWHLTVTVAIYVAVTTAYSYWLKNVVILDVVAVASGFVLRAIGGAAATGVPVSNWFFIVTSFGSLFVVTGKRQGEVGDLAEEEGEAADIRSTLEEYPPSFLAYLRAVSSGVVLVAYCVWAFEASAAADEGSIPWFELSILPFVVAILRYALLLDRGGGGTPEDLFFRDRPLLAAGLVWAVVYGTAVYLA
jgi:decaprenyl-phosphate phosphoribosyltransferase